MNKKVLGILGATIPLLVTPTLIQYKCPVEAAAYSKPNIVYILADDLGYGDVGCYGQKTIKTPVIDKMASEGIQFTRHYAGAPTCAPSRCTLMTGLSPGHASIRENDATNALWPEEVTIPDKMKEAGYNTAMIGKWGLGDNGTTGAPNDKGFDYFFGYTDQLLAHNYKPSTLVLNKGTYQVPPGSYSHDLFANDAIRYIRENKDKNFFLYLPFTIPHAEVNQVPDYGIYSNENWPANEKCFASMVTRMDTDIGRIFDTLKECGLDDNTIVMFASDNGPHSEGGHSADFFDSNGSLRGIKRDVYEGGIRTPLIVRWPGKIQPGITSDHITAFWDMMPTMCDLAGVQPPKTDGISILPVLLGQQQVTHPYLYWEWWEGNGKKAILKDEWKAVVNDLTAASNNGAAILKNFNGSQWVDGKVGNGLEFDGIDDWGDLTNGSTFLKTAFKEHSVSLWVRADKTSGIQNIYEEGGNNNGIALRLNNDTLEGVVQNVNAQNKISYNSFGTGWHHVALVYNGTVGTLKLYVDGSMVNSVAGINYSGGMVSTHTDPPALGCTNYTDSFDVNTTGSYFDGTLDEIYVYDHALTDAEVQTLKNAGDSSTIPHLVANYSLDEESGTIANNKVTGKNYSTELYNLKTDMSETTNVAATNPGIVEELDRLMASASKPKNFDFSPNPMLQNLVSATNIKFSAQGTANTAAKAVDRKGSTLWSAAGFPQYIEVDLGKVNRLSSTSVLPYEGRAYQYKIETSKDGTNYTKIVDSTDNTIGGAVLKNSFAETDARYVRLTVTGIYNSSINKVDLYEFRIFGEPIPFLEVKNAELDMGASGLQVTNLDIQNNTASTIDGNLMVGLYDRTTNRLVDIYALPQKQLFLPGSNSDNTSIIFNKIKSMDDYYIKVFIWNNSQGVQPLCKVFEN